MKFILFIMIVATVNMQTASSQSYDFSTGSFSGLGPKNAGDMVNFKIVNINTFRYKVTIKGSQLNYVTPIPTELQTLFRLPDPTKNVSDATEGAAKAEGAKNDMQNLTATLPASSLKTEMIKLVAVCSVFVVKAQAVRNIKFRRAELITLAKQNWVNHAALFVKLPLPGLTRASMQTAIQNFMDAYQNAEIQYAAALAEAAPGSDNEKRIQAALDKFKEGYEGIDEEDLMKYVDDVDILQNALADSRNFTVISPAVQAEGDFLAFNITIEPDQTNALLPHEASSLSKAEIPIRRGWKADFSVGPNFSIGEGARDEKYYLNPSSNGNGVLTKGENQSFMRPGIAAMLHAYPRTGKNFALGIMMGVGAGFKAEDILTTAFYLGPTLILGKTQRLMMNAGASFLPVNRLKVSYQEGKEYQMEATKIADLTEKIVRPSFFLGISYAITTRIESN